MTNWNDKSDFEINKWLADLLGLAIHEHQSASVKAKGNAVLICDSSAPYGIREVDYCKNWSDIGQLITEYDITVRGGGVAFVEHHHLDCAAYITRNENPCRAASICIIKLLESKQ